MNENTAKLFSAINNNERTHSGAAKHLSYIDAWMRNQRNYALEKSVKEALNKTAVKISTEAVRSLQFAARTVSKRFHKPIELSGVCTGEFSENEIYVREFHPYAEQECSSVETRATGFGRMQTFRELKAKGKKLLQLLTATI